MRGAPSSAGWRHSATTWSQWSGTSKPQAGACHLESPCALRTMRMPQLCRGHSRASMIWSSFRAMATRAQSRAATPTKYLRTRARWLEPGSSIRHAWPCLNAAVLLRREPATQKSA
jgi:hypothetical protein